MILETLAASMQAAELAKDLVGRVPSLQRAIVTDNKDPANLRRIKVAVSSKGGLLDTDWCFAMRLIAGYDPPIPPIGTTVIMAAIDDDPHNLVYLGPIINQANPQDDAQEDPIADSTLQIPGNQTESIGGNVDRTITGNLEQTISGTDDRRVEETLTVSVGQKLRLQNDAGAYVELHEAGAAIVGGIAGGQIVMGGQTAGLGYPTDFFVQATGPIRIDMQGYDLTIINATNASINGKQIATIGAVDSDGDTLTTRGW